MLKVKRNVNLCELCNYNAGRIYSHISFPAGRNGTPEVGRGLMKARPLDPKSPEAP